jgi:endonuclease/exonuclease/phosphatase family metal-dependent hydrolase
VLVRSWNLFHGNTLPPGRRAYLREMVELVTADRPDVVCLQEVPAWALSRLAGWSGMTALPALARRPSVGTAALGRALTSPHHGIIRSAFAGQGNAILVAPTLRLRATATLPLNERTTGVEPRVAQRAELELPDGRTAVLVNAHCSHGEPGETELARALAFGDEAAPAGALLVLAGDFNTTPEASATLRAAGFDAALAGSIDQVLLRGAQGTARAWEEHERAYGGRLLSDHAPVETTVRAGVGRVPEAML